MPQRKRPTTGRTTPKATRPKAASTEIIDVKEVGFKAALAEASNLTDDGSGPMPFSWGGRVWHAAEIPDWVKLDFAANTDPAARTQNLHSVIRGLVIEEEREEYHRFLREGFEPVRGDDSAKIIVDAVPAPSMNEMFEKAVEVVNAQAGRPTTPS